MRGWPILMLCALAACGPYPRDVDATLSDIEGTQVIRVGFADLRASDLASAQGFVARVEDATGARARVDTAPAETQLARLEDGQLDLVIGEFADDTPWGTEFAILEPLGWRQVGARRLGLSPVAANGENRWIALLEKAVRDRAAEAVK
jgi:hypothetical protein